MAPTLFTIGIYGWDEGVFHARLRTTPIDVLVDVRQRRGVRGRDARFGNVSRLEPALLDSGIDYQHLKDLAPSTSVRAMQAEEDSRSATTKRQRRNLSPAFVAAYRQQIDGSPGIDQLQGLLLRGHRPVLLCVERDPSACHRSVLAEVLDSGQGIEVHHLLP